ncbi:MAG: RnfH family protein [Sterolibacterium sp.]
MAKPLTQNATSAVQDSDLLPVEVVYALPQRQELIRLKLPSGSTLRQAVEASGLLQKYPEIDLAKNKLGIYGKLGTTDTVLREHDRIEIYRPLIADPKTARKQRAAESRAQKGKLGAQES